MDQLSQRSSSDRTQFMSGDDLDQEGSLDLDHDQYHYEDQDHHEYPDHELDHGQDQAYSQRLTRDTEVSRPAKTIEVKVQVKRR